LDVRKLLPRERHPLIFSRFDALMPGEAFVLVNDHEPKPLYYQFQAERAGQVGWEPIESGPERWAVRITRLGPAHSVSDGTVKPTQLIRTEHRGLLPHVDQLRHLGEVAELGSLELQTQLSTAVNFLQAHLLVHAQAEDRVLYPAVATLMGAPQATATMSYDHGAVARLTAELAALKDQLDAHAPTQADLLTLRRLAFGLHALVTLHFAKEEEVYLPLLDAHLTVDMATDLYRDMERAAAEIRRGR